MGPISEKAATARLSEPVRAFRDIQFEQYRKSYTSQYPPHAVVLNSRHAPRTHRGCESGGVTDNDCASSDSCRSDNGRGKMNEVMIVDDDDDDPLKLDLEKWLCNDAELKRLMHLRWTSICSNGGGLLNLGNTCFVNSVIQAIAYTPALAQYFLKVKTTMGRLAVDGCDYVSVLGETVRGVHDSTGGRYRPSLIVGNMRLLSPHFTQGRQGDAHEFLLHLLDACQRSLLRRISGPQKEHRHAEQTTGLRRIVGGFLRSTVSWSEQEEINCLKRAGKSQEARDLKIKCDHVRSRAGSGTLVSNTYDPFVTLSIDITGNTLEQCLRSFYAPEKLDAGAYITPRGVRVHAAKQFKLHGVPNVLIIHLKRFNGFQKVGKHVSYPMVLDMTPFCTADGTLKSLRKDREGDIKHSGDSVFYGASDSDTSVCKYELNAICVHEGSSLHYGHYYSIVRGRNGAWLLCNDERVSSCDMERARSKPAYILFYSRIEKERRTGCETGAPMQRRMSGVLSPSAGLDRPRVTPSVHGDNLESDLGRELTEEEVEKCLKGTRIHSKLPAVTAGDTEAGGRRADPNEGQCEQRGQTPVAPSCASVGKSQGSTDLSLPKAPGAVRSMKHVMPSQGKSGLHVALGHLPGDIVAGEAVASAMERKRESVPRTLEGPTYARKFALRVRDPEWEEEMDRGRKKHVRPKLESQTDVNKFQNSGLSFDCRGRRCLN
ncbi:putative Ubiquitin carboxyl terminal hydrolase [Trypanosoma vivax]|uniref:Ubiquitin carboxyl-terminal hydrolase n=1 Tax=Trypanosoma vivax (strain Y486) TaxID=1055687 RepID=G0UB76_TRYVY|nr:putative Ubiquitin carboxyl terminal hydrolase [Trypanosoma vivax]CCC53063.1 putative ubiquitin hydrolase [Trypanosoma vivax Y486]